MKLFELRPGLVGESYVRAYAWAESEEEALRLYAEKAHGTRHDGYPPVVVTLFDAGDAPFCTVPSDSGWEGDTEPMVRTKPDW